MELIYSIHGQLIGTYNNIHRTAITLKDNIHVLMVLLDDKETFKKKKV